MRWAKDIRRSCVACSATFIPVRHASYLSSKITFVLDACSASSIEQNNIIKIFSIGQSCSCRRPVASITA